MGSLGMTTWLCSVGSTMLNSRKTLFFKISFSLPERVGWRLFRCPRAGSVHVGQLRSGWAGSDPVALTAPLLPRETQTQQCLLRGWVFAWRLSLINPSWKVIWLNVLFVSFFRFFFFLISFPSFQKSSGGGDFATLRACSGLSLSLHVTTPYPSAGK